MVCCKCNRSSKCRLCACVKAGSRCSDCLPSQLGTCRNLSTVSDEAEERETPNAQLEPIQTISQTALQQETDSRPVSSQHSTLILGSQRADHGVWPLPLLKAPNFTWGNLLGTDLCKNMKEVYDEVVHWRRNLFQVPSGSAGRAFVAELARLYQGYADHSSLKSVALTACSVAPILLLQKPSRTSKSKDHMTHLQTYRPVA